MSLIQLEPIKEVLPNDLYTLLQPEKYRYIPRENVIARSDPEVLFPSSASHFYIKPRGKGNDYLDFRESYLSYDIIGTNITQEQPEIMRVEWLECDGTVSTLAHGAYKIIIGDFYVPHPTNGTDVFGADVQFNTIISSMQAIINRYFAPLQLSLDTVGTNTFQKSATMTYRISNFDDDDLAFVALRANNYNFIHFEVVNACVSEKSINVVPQMRLLQAGSLSFPRLIYGAMSPFSRIYCKLGQNFPTCDNANILHNILITGEDLDYPDSFARSRAMTLFGLPLNRFRRISFPLYTAPMINQFILPSFLSSQFEIHIESESAERVLLRNPNNLSQSFEIRNIEFNYYLLKIPIDIDNLLYQKALEGQLSIIFNGYQSIRTSVPTGTQSLEQTITYSYKSIEKLFSVMLLDSNINNNLEVNRLNRFLRQGILTTRFQTSSGYTYPRENLRIIGNDIAQFQSEYLRAIGLPLTRKKYESGLRSTCLGLLNYIGDGIRFNVILGRPIPESFIIAINTNYNSSDIKTVPVVCDRGVTSEGGSGTRLFIDNCNVQGNSTLYTFLYYCGQVVIGPDMMANIYM